MQLVTQINTVFEDDIQPNYEPRVTIEHPEGLTLDAWRRQNLGPGWSQFCRTKPVEGEISLGYTVREPNLTVWLHVREVSP